MANYCYYCLHKLKMLPSTFLNLPLQEKAFIIAAIDIKMKSEKKQINDIKKVK